MGDQKIRVFLNARASSGERADLVEGLRTKLFRSELEFVAPRSLDELRGELRRSVEMSADAIVAVGGDGTANTMIQILAGSEVGLLLIPAGTANDLAREVGLDGRSTDSLVRKAVQALRSARARKIDLIRVNGKYMATNGGLGLGALVATDINDLRARYPAFKGLMRFAGSNIYTAALVARLMSPVGNRWDFILEAEGRMHEFKTPIFMVNNQPALGGSFQIAPGTRNDDGSFNISVFRHRSRLKFLRCLAGIRGGRDPRNDPDFTSLELSRLSLRTASGESLPFFGDGELLCEASSFEIEIVPRGLRLFSPLPDPLELKGSAKAR